MAAIAGHMLAAGASPVGALAVKPGAGDDGFQVGANWQAFAEKHCLACHDHATQKGGLRLDTLSGDLREQGRHVRDQAGRSRIAVWERIHDRIAAGEMPPPPRKRPPADATAAVLADLAAVLTATDWQSRTGRGRALLRRLNRTEYEHTLRDLLDLPDLAIRDLLPEDGRDHGFDKTATALEFSSIQMSKYLEAATVALDRAIATRPTPPEVHRQRLYPGDQYQIKIILTNGDAVFLKDLAYDMAVFPPIRDKAPFTMGQGEKNGLFPYKHSVGIFRHEDDAYHGNFQRFSPLVAGRYRLRMSIWAFGWDRGQVVPAQRTEVASLVVARGRLIGYFDAPSLKPTVHEVEAWLEPGDVVVFNAASLPPVRVSERKGRAAEYVGPGVAIDWLDVEGPLHDTWPPASHRQLFGDLVPTAWQPTDAKISAPRRTVVKQQVPGAAPPTPKLPPVPKGQKPPPSLWTVQPPGAGIEAATAQARKLLANWLPRAFRGPVSPATVQRYLTVVTARLGEGACFEDALRSAYLTALCSPDFLYLRQTVADPATGRLDDFALANRLSYFLWNSMPDNRLMQLAGAGQLRQPQILKAEVDRLLGDPRAQRLANDLADQWFDLRKIDLTSPDRRLYPEYGEYLRNSQLAETQAFVAEMIRTDAPLRDLVASSWGILNDVLAEHYDVPGVVGSALRKITWPANAGRGGVITQGAILKVTANGTTTSPVTRGAWVLDKILGQPPQPPPPNIPAVEPDLRGAVTIRQQLDAHRADASCATCHAKIDPPGFALESYDVIGGRRTRYRSLGEGDRPDDKTTKGRRVGYKLGPAVDTSGQTAQGQAFRGLDDYRAVLVGQSRQLAVNAASQLAVYATGAAVSFADRAEIDAIVHRTASRGYGLRSLIHELVQSPLFVNK